MHAAQQHSIEAFFQNLEASPVQQSEVEKVADGYGTGQGATSV